LDVIHCRSLSKFSQGTGKSIALLCSIIAFLNTWKLEDRPHLYVVSRTHQQINQMIEELISKSNLSLSGASMAIKGTVLISGF